MKPTTWLIIFLALGIPATYASTSVYYEMRMAGAVRAERDAGVRVCDARIAELGAQSKEEASKRARVGEEAAAGVSRTPEERNALIELCKRSASCRDRGKL